MTTKSKSIRNKTPQEQLPLQRECPEATSVDLFVVHEEDADHASRVPAAKTVHDILKELPPEADYHKVLSENRIAEAAKRIAHEMNDPLTVVLVYSQLLLSRGNLDEAVKAGLEVIYRETERASLLNTSLFFYSRREKPEKKLISIQETIQRTLEFHIPSLRANNIEIVVRLQPDMPKTMADPYQMQQLFRNIITNAEQAMSEAHGKGILCIKAQKAGEMIRISFEDNGPGIPQNDFKRIFEPFYTTKEVGKGLGLGLSICSSIVEGHSGNIYALSKHGKGATFIVELPFLA